VSVRGGRKASAQPTGRASNGVNGVNGVNGNVNARA
jgi:hypothetical protein